MVGVNSKSELQVYGYRWIILLVFGLINLIIQIQWLAFAPIAKAAQSFYGVSALEVDLFSIVYLVVFIIFCIPSTYIINHYGLYKSIGLGAVLAGVFGMTKGLFAANYTLAIISQIGLAFAQPLIINSGTTLAVRWFPITERATATGLAMLTQFLGMIIAMILTPQLIETGTPGVYDISGMLMTYGVMSLASAILLLVFLRDKPPTSPSVEEEDRYNILEGIRYMLKNRDMQYLLILFFLALGLFNAVTTCIDQICKIKGLDFEQTGLVGGMMLISGVLGAGIFPVISDKLRKRKVMFTLLAGLSIPGLLGLTVAMPYIVLLVSSFVFGFFFLGSSPIFFQYSAEINFPAPESASQGLLMLAGQIGGVIFVVGMNSLGMMPAMYLFVGFSLVNLFLCLKMKESEMIQVGQAAAEIVDAQPLAN